ncbi:glyoxalase [Lottiidibacillus patelloidae]|uniref:Glyoxalase n=1 Tax=Lottiidibacillus patelloidae TaxID=2670334 RepID=A0A263BQZ3_9BACI|nr:VOC family protein [Lottiidibacillus patelloidae]OZM56125.1 glyoxalase [Lottiidibacillus patelloidae]
MSKVIHFEIQVPNPEKTMKFYEEVCDWRFEKWDGPEDYWLVYTGEDDSPGIDGGLMRSPDGQARTTNTIAVENVDDYIKKVEEHGGVVVVPKMPIPSVGYLAYCKDPEGHLFGIMHLDSDAK